MLLYALTIFVSAFLLFQVQPIIAKIILPWFGGSAAVWTVCMLFFQIILLLGYLYAHWSIKRFKPKIQTMVHVALLAASCLVLPVLPSEAWKPAGGENPAFRILFLLGATVGLPYFLVSTTGPLLQAWYARKFHGTMPYRLYALSNVGSMLALVGYPIIVEPFLPTRTQAVDWSGGYIAFALLCALTAWRSGSLEISPEQTEAASEGAPPHWKQMLIWIGLAACSSTLLLAVTNHLSQNVAAIPFLWIIPLSLYLLSFIICFELRHWNWPGAMEHLPAVAIGAMAYGLSSEFENPSVRLMVPLYAGGLFLCCLLCHGELARQKPHPRYLTNFYLMISIGGAVGGLFVALLAPAVFKAYYELQIGLAASAAVALLAIYHKPSESWYRPVPIIALGLTAFLFGYLANECRKMGEDTRLMVRNFYGGLRVTEDEKGEDAVRKLLHGTINHGEQFLSTTRRILPTTYYSRNSGIGLAIRSNQYGPPIRVGIIGLGTGTLAAYGRAGDYYRFYEINPLVIDIARKQFTYLSDCRARTEIALGDARLSLEREPPQNFDVLAVDAFSGDSIPVHLLTKEAMQLYFRHLKSSGVLGVHISNKYLDLQPVVEQIAAALDKKAVTIDIEDDETEDAFGSMWVLVTGWPGFFNRPLLLTASIQTASKKKLRVWTDDYSNLFQILK